MTADPALHHWRFTVDEYERMAELGILDADARIELLDGEIVEMSPMKPPHASVVARMNRLLTTRLGERAVIFVQSPVRLPPRSKPEPDLTVAHDRADFYVEAHPTVADTFVVIEVADSSLRTDLLVKVPIYARQGVPEAWVVDVQGRRVIVHTDPVGDGYRHVRTAYPGEEITPRLLPELTVTVDEIFGK